MIACCPTPIQEAVAIAFKKKTKRMDSAQCYFKSLPAELEPKRDRMVAILRDAGFIPYIPEGCYFMIVDVSALPAAVAMEIEKEGKDVVDTSDFRFSK
jgi:kynurenine--oxoglutarate transaminase/cysteine-S-conjugate beta-lyase/glutamine--phenylpyruvate transaminase